jgi:hypothetical protein
MSHAALLLVLGMISQASPPPASKIAIAEPNLQERIAKNGGTKESVAAVDLALEWLAQRQMPTGYWSLAGEDPAGKGSYSRGSRTENHEAATAMALLAFTGAGHTHQAGKYGPQIDRGARALLKSQDAVGNFFKQERADEWMYTQALCTKALCELYALTNDPKLRDPCRKAVQFCLDAQGKEGGWRYRPQSDSDTSVTGWMVSALVSAKKAKLDVPQANLDRIGKYLDLAAAGPVGLVPRRGLPGSRYAYMPGEDVDNSAMTAEGLLCRMHLGWRQDDPRLVEGINYLLDRYPPEWKLRDVYYWHHATQAMFHFGGDSWKSWNELLRDTVVAEQKVAGPERGSWDPLTDGWPAVRDGADTWAMNNVGGRLYVTCFTTYMLEI